MLGSPATPDVQRIPSGKEKGRTYGAYSTCMATSGNGARIGTETIRNKTQATRKVRVLEVPACAVADRGTMVPGSAVPLLVTEASLATGAATTVSVLVSAWTKSHYALCSFTLCSFSFFDPSEARIGATVKRSIVCFAAVPGKVFQESVAPPTATATRRSAASTTAVFGFCCVRVEDTPNTSGEGKACQASGASRRLKEVAVYQAR